MRSARSRKHVQSSLCILQVLEVFIKDSRLTLRPAVGFVRLPLSRIPADGCLDAWLPVRHHRDRAWGMGGELHLTLTYKPFVEEESEAGSSAEEAEAYAVMLQRQAITDIRSAAGEQCLC